MPTSETSNVFCSTSVALCGVQRTLSLVLPPGSSSSLTKTRVSLAGGGVEDPENGEVHTTGTRHIRSTIADAGT